MHPCIRAASRFHARAIPYSICPSAVVARVLQSSLTVSLMSARRFAWDGNSYTEHEFHEWYGDHYRLIWIDMRRNGDTEHDHQREASWNMAANRDTQSGVAMDPWSGDTEHVPVAPSLVAPAPALPGLQCPLCRQELCQAHSVYFPDARVEIQLILTPDSSAPPKLMRVPVTERGALQTWQCACGAQSMLLLRAPRSTPRD